MSSAPPSIAAATLAAPAQSSHFYQKSPRGSRNSIQIQMGDASTGGGGPPAAAVSIRVPTSASHQQLRAAPRPPPPMLVVSDADMSVPSIAAQLSPTAVRPRAPVPLSAASAGALRGSFASLRALSESSALVSARSAASPLPSPFTSGIATAPSPDAPAGATGAPLEHESSDL